MSAELGFGVNTDSPAGGRGGPPPSYGAGFSPSDLWVWVKFVLSLGLGIALGAENLNAPEASGWLRVPALLAALILCAQAPVDLAEYNRRREVLLKSDRAVEEERRKLQAELERAHSEGQQTEELTTRIHRPWAESSSTVESAAVAAAADELDLQAKKEEAEERLTAAAVANSRSALMSILILAIWLGLATLNYPAAPPLLLWLSLVASVLLFMSVWGGLQRR
jgi:hypothetical protein